MTDHTPATDSTDQIPEPPTETPDEPLSFWARWGELLVAAGVLALGIVVLVETQDIRVRQGVVVSPRIIPNIVGSGLVLLAIWYAIDVIRAPHMAGGGEDAEDVDPEAKTDWSVMVIIAVALTLYALLMDTAGFIVASTALFTVSSFAMGSRRLLRDVLIALLLAVGTFLMFDSWLGVRLPSGWFEGLL